MSLSTQNVPMTSGYVYIMTNRSSGTLYIGVTANIAARVTQHRETLPIHSWIRILNGTDNTHHACVDQRLGTRRCSSRVRTWLERGVSRRSACRIARVAKCVDFRVMHTVPGVETFPDHRAILHEHSPNHRARARQRSAAAGKFEGAADVVAIVHFRRRTAIPRSPRRRTPPDRRSSRRRRQSGSESSILAR